MPYNSGTGAYERRSTTVIDASPDGDTVYIAIDAKLDQAADDTVTDLNHHKENGNHYPATSTHTDSRFLKQSPAGVVAWADGVPAPDAALKDFSNVASGAIAPEKIAQDAENRFATDTEKSTWNAVASTTVPGRVELATDAEAQAGTDTERAVTPAGMKACQIVFGALATASGVAIDFEGIPSWAKRITVMIDGLSTNGINPIVMQVGGATFQTTAYLGSVAQLSNVVASSLHAAGFFLTGNISAASFLQGKSELSRAVDGKWYMNSNVAFSHSAGTNLGSGKVIPVGAITKVRITTVGGTDQFDAGSISIAWE